MAAERSLPRYRVAAVERTTRIPATTLRSWERRYGWPRPFQTASGQRLYCDHDLAVIRFLDRLVADLRAFDEAGAERTVAAAETLLGVEAVATGLIPAAVDATLAGRR